jgi:hypothetical protein
MIAVNTTSATAALPGQIAVESRIDGKRAKHKEKGGESMEQRLDRLEHMVESLMARDKTRQKDSKDKEFSYNFKFDDKWKAGMPDKEDLNRINEFAKRQAEMVSRENQRAVREVEKVRRDQVRGQDEKLLAEMHEPMPPMQKPHSNDFDLQRQQLEAVRKALEKQMHALEKQIDRLNNEQEKAQHRDEENERRIERRNHNSNNSKPDDSSSEPGPRLKPNADTAPAR